MINYPESLDNLIGILKQLPGVGKRTAERYALSMLKWKEEKLIEFGNTLLNLNEDIGHCEDCGAITNNGERCQICRSHARDRSIICIIEDFTQLCTIENSNFYRGLYHILGGKISPLDDNFGENLRINSLIDRVESDEVSEIIIALGADVESRATAIYIADLLKDYDVKISQLSQGIPAGGNLIYADGATISLALKNRTEV